MGFYYYLVKMILQGFWLRFTLLFMGSVKLVAVINPEELVNLIEYYFISQNIFVVTYYSCFSMGKISFFLE